MMVDDNTKRRRFLKLLGAGSAGFLAGCSGGDGGDGGGDGGDDSTPEVETVIKTVEGEERTVIEERTVVKEETVIKTPEENYPERPIELIIPYGTGGGFNYYSRLTSKYIESEDYLPVQITPNNVTPDLAGHNQLFNSDPNGYTVGVVSVSSMSKAQVLRDEARFDLREMTTFPRIAGTVEAIAVGTHTDITSASELVEAMQAGELNVYGESLTGGSILDLVALGGPGGLYSPDRVIDNFVQYDTQSAGIAGMRRGEVDVISSAISSLLQYGSGGSGDVRIILALTTGDPPKVAPEGVETLDDLPIENPGAVTGFLGVEFDRVFAGPPDIPEPRANLLRDAFAKAIKNPDLQAEASQNDRPINFASSKKADAAIDDAVSSAQDNQELLRRLFGS